MYIKRAGGLTLIELIVFIVIVSVGVAGVLVVFDTVTRRSADPIRAKQALAVAEGMLDEILNKNFCDPDTETPSVASPPTPAVCVGNVVEASRALYDDTDDYNGYATTGVNDVTGSPISVLSGYNVSVAVQTPAANFVVGSDTVTPTNYRIVTASVTDTVSNQRYDVIGYKFNND